MGASLGIAEESPDQAPVRALLAAGDEYAASLYPAESNHGSGVSELQQPNATFLVARLDGEVVGTAAFLAKDGYAEIKRMFVHDRARGLKLGKRLLQALEDRALQMGLTVMRLETGVSQPEALGLYRKAGYEEIGPFGTYRADPLSVFMEKLLGVEGNQA